MNNKLIKEIQKYYYSLKDSKGNSRKQLVGVIGNAETSVEGISRVMCIIDIIMHSDSISEETKTLISNIDISVKDINEQINERRKADTIILKRKVSEVSYATTLKHISEDNQKIAEVFGYDIIKDCVYNRLESYNELDKKINSFALQYGRCEKIRENLYINIDTSTIGKLDQMNSDDFFAIIGSLEVYLKQRIKVVENAINNNTEFIQYFNYLLSERSISDESSKADRERLLKFLNNEDYISGYENGN